MTDLEATWLAGLLEGEGCFRLMRAFTEKRRDRICVALQMTDQDVVQRAADLMECRAGGPYMNPRRPDHSPTWKCQVTGAKAERLMREVLPHMGSRRAAKIRELLATPNLAHTPRMVAA